MDCDITDVLHRDHYLVEADLAQKCSFAEDVWFFESQQRFTSLGPALENPGTKAKEQEFGAMRIVVSKMSHLFLFLRSLSFLWRIQRVRVGMTRMKPGQDERKECRGDREQQHPDMRRVAGESIYDVEMRNDLGRKRQDGDEVKWRQEPEAGHAAEGTDEEVRFLEEVACNRVGQRGYVKPKTFLHLSILNQESG